MILQKVTKITLVTSGILLVLLLSILVRSRLIESGLALKPAREPIIVNSSAALIKRSPKELVASADRIVLGTVETVYPSRWNTPDGNLPSNTTIQTLSPDTRIFTDVAIRVERNMKGPVGDVVRVRIRGGTVGQDTMIADYEPEFAVGQRILLFLRAEDDRIAGNIGPEHYVVAGALQGKYDIVGADAVSRGGDRQPLGQLLALIPRS